MDAALARTLIECPICTEVRCKYFQCNNGHIICQACEANLPENICPMCKTNYPTPKVRSLQTEQMITVLEFEVLCKYSANGCFFMNLKSRVDDHEVTCEFRRVTCTISGCNVTFLAKHRSAHDQVYHLPCPNASSGCSFIGTKVAWEVHKLKCEFQKINCPSPNCSIMISKNSVQDHVKGCCSQSFRISKDGSLLLLVPSTMNSGPDLLHFEKNSFLLVIQNFRTEIHIYMIDIGLPDQSSKFRVRAKAFKDKEMVVSREIKMFSLDPKNLHNPSDQDCFILSQKQVNQLKKDDKVAIKFKIMKK